MQAPSRIFDNPPIREVVIATYFNPSLDAFQSQYVGRLWENLKDRYPIVRQQFPVGIDHDINPNEPFPMPRYMFITRDDATAVQIEKNALILNWRHRNNGTFPSFSTDIKPAFDTFYVEFEHFLRAVVDIPEVSIGLCELTYVNIVEQCDYWDGSGDVGNVIWDLSVPSLVADAPPAQNFNCQFAYSAADSQISVRIGNAESQLHAEQQALVFEIRASAEFESASKAEADRWFDRAHRLVSECFMHITATQIQENYWGLRTEGTL